MPGHSIKHLSEDDFSLAVTSTTNLSINYIPSKFSEFRKRKYDDVDEPHLPKTGGGLFAFRTNEARMAQGKGRLKWNRFKWILFATNALVWFFT